MSIFNKQSKKEEVVLSEEEQFTNQIKENSRDFKEVKVLEALHKVLPGSRVTHEGVYIETLNLTIDTGMPHVNGAVVQLIFYT